MKIMVISPHPDDETLGAGGTLLKFAHSGHSINWVNVTNMKTEYGFCQNDVEKRQNEIECVKQLFGFEQVFDFGLCPAKIEELPINKIIDMFKTVFERIKPDILIMPYRFDVHSDHRIVYDAVYSCIKAFRAPYLKTVLGMEIISETDQASYENGFCPNIFVDITDFIEKKLEIMHKYESEIKDAPFPRNDDAIKGLASFRGATGGYKYAEAFCLIRGRL